VKLVDALLPARTAMRRLSIHNRGFSSYGLLVHLRLLPPPFVETQSPSVTGPRPDPGQDLHPAVPVRPGVGQATGRSMHCGRRLSACGGTGRPGRARCAAAPPVEIVSRAQGAVNMDIGSNYGRQRPSTWWHPGAFVPSRQGPFWYTSALAIGEDPCRAKELRGAIEVVGRWVPFEQVQALYRADGWH